MLGPVRTNSEPDALALSRNIARSHHGDLVHEKTPGGASFLLTLPLEAA